MLQINSYNTSSAYGAHRTNRNFGQKENDFQRITNVLTEENRTGKSDDEFKAQKLEKLAEIINENKKAPSALKSFTIVGALSVASGLTAAAVSGRLYGLLNQTMPILGKAGKYVLNNMGKAQKYISQAAKKQEGIKATLLKAGDKTLVWFQDLSKKGIKKELAEIAHKDKAELANLRKQIREAAARKGQKLTAKEVNAELKNRLQNEAQEAMGANLLKKGTKTFVGATAGVGTLKEAATDENKDGIPDVVQGKDAHKKATEQVTAALIDCALDTCGI